MSEDFVESAQEQFDWKKYWAVASRRRWYFLLPFFLGWTVVWSVSWFLPSMYRSATLILVERPTSVVDASGAGNMQNRLDSITQQALSRTRLLNIINTLNLFADERNRGIGDDELVERMRKNIEIELVRTNDRELSSFKIYFSGRTPEQAQQVTTELTNILITENLETTTEDLRHRTQFLDNQLEDARKNLEAQEERVRVYKDRHLGELPGQLQSNLQILSGLQSQVQAEQDALGRAKQQNAYLDSLQSQYTTLAGTLRPGETANGGLPAIDRELERLRSHLADLSSQYTDQHPDVRKTKEQIAKTEKMKQQLEAAPKALPGDQATENMGAASGPLLEVRSQLKANQLEISNRQRSVDNLHDQISSYQARLNRTPVREQELADLTRDYDQSRSHYESLLEKKNKSKLLENEARDQQSEHFRMMDPPSRPSKPSSPNRFKLSLIGLVVGLVLGVGLAGGAELLDDRIYEEEEFKKLLPAEILVEIPPMLTVQEQQSLKGKNLLHWAVAGAMGVVIVAGTVISFLPSR